MVVGFLTVPKVSPSPHTHTLKPILSLIKTDKHTDLSFEAIQGFPKVRGAAHTRALVLVTHTYYNTNTTYTDTHKHRKTHHNTSIIEVKNTTTFFDVLKSARNLTKEK